MFDSLKNRLYLFLTAITGFFMIWILGCVFYTARNDFWTEFCPIYFRLLILTISAILMGGALLALYSVIDKMTQKQVILLCTVLFLVMSLIYIFLAMSLRIIPQNDSHSMLDEALSLYRSKSDHIAQDGVYSNYFSKYSNNYFLTIIFVNFFKLLDFLHIENIYLGIYLLNAFALLLGCLLTVLTAYKMWNIYAATRVLVLFVFNPAYYLMMFWVYSNTLSIPFMMGILYFGISFYKCCNYFKKIIYILLISVISALAYLIRPTAVFPLIALIICAIMHFTSQFFNNRQIFLNRKNIIFIISSIIIFTSCFGLAYKLASTKCDDYFGTVSENNYPVTHWLMMGSHDSGKYNLADDRFTFSLDANEKTSATIAKTMQNYKSLGIPGTINLWLRKTATTWSDGYFGIGKRLSQIGNHSSIYRYIQGDNNDTVIFICQCIWIIIIFLGIINIYTQRLREQVLTFDFVILLTIFGGIVFYLFWEVKSAYAIPFIPLFILLSQNGSRQLTIHLYDRVKSSNYVKPLFRTFSLSIFVFIFIFQIESNKISNTPDYNIRMSGLSWMEELTLSENDDNFDTLSQSFYADNSFDSIDFVIDPNCKGNFVVSLFQDNNNILYQTIIDPTDFTETGTVDLHFDTLPASKQAYYLSFTKTDDFENDIVLQTRKGECLYTYDGELKINNNVMPLGLYLSVYLSNL